MDDDAVVFHGSVNPRQFLDGFDEIVNCRLSFHSASIVNLKLEIRMLEINLGNSFPDALL